MAQLNNTFTYSALDTSTAPGTPITGLTNVRFNLFKINRDSSGVVTSGTQVVTDGLCVEIGGGGYAYTYTGYSPSLEYYYYITPNDSRCYVEQGATDPIEQLISEVRGGGGGGSINISGIQTTIRNARDTIVQEIGKAKDETLGSINETNSHIDIAKGEITDKIESIEIPEAKLEEKEAKKVLKIVTDTSKTLKSYIDSEMKEKDDIKEISSEFLKLEKEEKEREMKEKEEEKMKEEEDKRKEEEEKKKEAENDAKLLEEIQKEFDAMEEEDKQEKKKELEQELKELEKEMKEKEKELNSIK